MYCLTTSWRGNAADLFGTHGGPRGGQYKLSAVACYYGAHWSVLLYRPDVKDEHGVAGWLSVDDTTGSVIGKWPAAIHKMSRGGLQPAILLYERIH